LLREREELYRSAEQRLARPEGALNNVWLAMAITYSRHSELMQRALDAFDGDLAQAVAFFRRVDAAKPVWASSASGHVRAGEGAVHVVRAQEAAIVDVIEELLGTLEREQEKTRRSGFSDRAQL
jgi:hypothetical protein